MESKRKKPAIGLKCSKCNIPLVSNKTLGSICRYCWDKAVKELESNSITLNEEPQVIGSPTTCSICNTPMRSCIIPATCYGCEEKQRLNSQAKENPTVIPFDVDQYQKNTERTECDNQKVLEKLGTEKVRLLHACIGIGKEAGELQDIIAGLVFYGRRELNSDLAIVVKNELGDILYFVALACNICQLDMSEVMAANERKLRTRYPEKFDEERYKRENRDVEGAYDALTGD